MLCRAVLCAVQNVWGRADPGDMVALMGPSGAGKSTLMDILAGRKSVGELKGVVLVNKQRQHKPTFRKRTAYVPQVCGVFHDQQRGCSAEECCGCQGLMPDWQGPNLAPGRVQPATCTLHTRRRLVAAATVTSVCSVEIIAELSCGVLRLPEDNQCCPSLLDHAMTPCDLS